MIARANLGRLLNERGDQAGARAQVELARRAAQASSDPEASLRASIFEAGQLATDGVELGRAHRILRGAEARLFPDGPRGLQLTLLRSLAQVSDELGLYDEAIDRLQRLIEMRQAAGDLAAVPRHRLNLLVSRYGQLELRPTREGVVQLRMLAEQVRADAHAYGDPNVEARAEALLADLWRADDPARAGRHLERCGRVARTLPSTTPLIRCLVATATLRAAGDPEEAERALGRAMDLARRHGGDGWIGYVTGTQLRLAWAGHTGVEVAEASLRRLDALERLREAQPDDEARIGVMRRRISVYNWLAGRLLESDPPDVARAFAVSERMRARVLQERLESGGRTGPRGRRCASETASERRSRACSGACSIRRSSTDRARPCSWSCGSWSSARTRRSPGTGGASRPRSRSPSRRRRGSWRPTRSCSSTWSTPTATSSAIPRAGAGSSRSRATA